MLLAVLPLFRPKCCSLTLPNFVAYWLLSNSPKEKKLRAVKFGDRGSQQKSEFLESIQFLLSLRGCIY